MPVGGTASGSAASPLAWDCICSAWDSCCCWCTDEGICCFVIVFTGKRTSKSGYAAKEVSAKGVSETTTRQAKRTAPGWLLRFPFVCSAAAKFAGALSHVQECAEIADFPASENGKDHQRMPSPGAARPHGTRITVAFSAIRDWIMCSNNSQCNILLRA